MTGLSQEQICEAPDRQNIPRPNRNLSVTPVWKTMVSKYEPESKKTLMRLKRYFEEVA